MEYLKPAALLDRINKDGLGEFDRAVYEGTKRLVELCDPGSLFLGTSASYRLTAHGELSRGYFSFTSHQDTIISDVLVPVERDLLLVARDAKLMEVVEEAIRKGFEAAIPTEWTACRQVNQGLYESAAQFDIEPPCLNIGNHCKEPGKFVRVAEDLAEIVSRLDNLRVQRRRGE
jgi:hypothetical protein